ncbi:hypothetical protein niasHT_002538 [Heterodera trifolii]|uniref:Uncharacterized protein n=1 Tax=Heterodera trifolii TaxID=157864 RepID=A0ABD2LQ01_9BILA
MRLLLCSLYSPVNLRRKSQSLCKSPTRNTDDVKGRKANGKLGTIFSPKAGEELAEVAATNFENLLKIGKSPNFPIDDRKCAQEAATDGIIRPEKRADFRFVRCFYRSDPATRLHAEPTHC